LESKAGERHQLTSKRLYAHAISDLTDQKYHAMCVGKPRCSSRFWTWRITVPSQSARHFRARTPTNI